MNFNFLMRTELRFGRGGFDNLAECCLPYGKRVALLTGAGSLEASGRLGSLTESLDRAGLETSRLIVPKEPDTELVDDLRNGIDSADCVLAVGGGSVIDTGKAISALLTNPGSITDYLEGLPEGGGRAPENAAVPTIAVPTTAGTGAEVTKNAVIQVNRWGIKRSMRTDTMLPVMAVIDPDLIENAPARTLAAAAFDAFGHLLEAYLSSSASPITDALAMTGLERASEFLRNLVSKTVATAHFEDMAIAATLGGLCLANARLGAAHGLVSPLCGKTGMPHGEGVACLTSHALRSISRLMDNDNPSLAKLGRVAELLGAEGNIEAAADILESWRVALNIPDATKYGLDESLVQEISASPSSSIHTNPVQLNEKQREEIILSLLKKA